MQNDAAGCYHCVILPLQTAPVFQPYPPYLSTMAFLCCCVRLGSCSSCACSVPFCTTAK